MKAKQPYTENKKSLKTGFFFFLHVYVSMCGNAHVHVGFYGVEKK